jgi:hypothetical protein
VKNASCSADRKHEAYRRIATRRRLRRRTRRRPPCRGAHEMRRGQEPLFGPPSAPLEAPPLPRQSPTSRG